MNVFLRRAFQCLAAVLLIVMFVYSLSFSNVKAYFSKEILLVSLLLQPMVFLHIYIVAYRFKYLLGNKELPNGSVFKATILSHGLSLIMMAKTFILVKLTYLKSKHNVPMATSIAAATLEQFFDLAIVAGLGFFAVGSVSVAMSPWVLGVLAILPFLALKFFAMSRHFWVKWATRLNSHLGNLLERVGYRIEHSLKPTDFIVICFITILIWASAFIFNSIYLLWIGSIPLTFSQLMVLFVVTSLAMGLPGLPGSLGTYEAAVVFCLRPYGYSLDEALAISLGLRFMRFVGCVVLTKFLLFREKLGIIDFIHEYKKSKTAKI